MQDDQIIKIVMYVIRKYRIFCYKNVPDMPIAVAVRMSTSIPYVFSAYKYLGKYYVDGGLSDNYPINIFDDPDEKDYAVTTLGLKMMASGEKRDSQIFHSTNQTSDVFSYTKSLVNHIMNTIERSQISRGYWERTITVPTGNITMTEFDISHAKKLKYVELGYAATKKALIQYAKNGKFI